VPPAKNQELVYVKWMTNPGDFFVQRLNDSKQIVFIEKTLSVRDRNYFFMGNTAFLSKLLLVQNSDEQICFSVVIASRIPAFLLLWKL